MSNEELLSTYAALAMALQEEYMKRPQDFAKQQELQHKFSNLKAEALRRMEANNE